MSSAQTRTYQRAESVVFLKTNEAFGGLSNMAGGFPLRVNGVRILTSEALYQACRFPHLPDVQRLIIEQRSPMTAKMKGKPHRSNSRGDWFQVRVKIMRWCLRVKLAQNWRKFSELLLETCDRPIVEQSRKDDFWGAKPVDDDTLVGMNVLGRLLMELREAVKTETRETLCFVESLAIPDFLLGGEPIGVVATRVAEIAREETQPDVQESRGYIDDSAVVQQSLFDEPMVKESPPPAKPGVKEKGVRIVDLKPYAEYKDSDAPWFGDVPGHWEVKRLGSVFAERSETNEKYEVAEVLSVLKDIGVIPYSEKGRIGNKKSEDTGRYKIVRPDDLVVNCMNVIIGSVGLSRYTGCLSPVYYVLKRRKSEHLPRYLELVFKHKPFQRSLVRIGNGILAHRMRIQMEKLKAELFPLPPPEEQEAIVRFLDWANGRLERAIRAKRKVIALLNEQKQAIIHRAVTRGLDPSVPLKPSGIPWLGDIPQHWEVRRLKHLARFQSGDGITSMEIEAAGPYPVYGGNGLRGYTNRFTHEGHYALVGRQGALCGNINFANGQFFASEHAVVAALQPGMSVLWFGELLRVMNLNQYSQSAAQPGLAVERIKNLHAPVPSISEQKTIVESFERDTAPLAAAISRLDREIELLREYRTRLVADVVTGKLDVREAAARLPDEAPLDTVEDDADLGDEAEGADEEAAV